jgi:hypothetical protein
VADVYAALVKQILDLAQRQWKADIHHHREADNFRRAIEIAKGIVHRRKLQNAPPRLKSICSDTAMQFPWQGNGGTISLNLGVNLGKVG